MSLNRLKNAKLYDDFVWHNRRYKLRTDINDFCQTRFEANIIRIILSIFIKRNFNQFKRFFC